MAVITAAMVKALRVKTDAPMMECKKALAEADGDAAKAEEILRVKLGNKATKAAARITAEGIVTVFISEDGKTGAVLETNSETDFVAKNPEFQQMAKDAVRLVAEKAPADVAALSALELNGQTLEQVRTALVGKIGENMSFRRFVRFEAQGKLHQYVHGGSKIAALVDVVGGDEELAHDVAMHIAASKPKALDKDGVDPALIETERRVALEKAKEAGKPEALLPRIAEGTVQKFLKEVTLINQPFVKDDSVTVGALLKSKGAKVAAFALYVVGCRSCRSAERCQEGLKSRNENFPDALKAGAFEARKAPLGIQPGCAFLLYDPRQIAWCSASDGAEKPGSVRGWFSARGFLRPHSDFIALRRLKWLIRSSSTSVSFSSCLARR